MTPIGTCAAVFFLFIFHCRYFHLYSSSYYYFIIVYKYLCCETGCRNNFVTYLCTPCIYYLCNKSIKYILVTCADTTHKRQGRFLEFPPSTFPSTVCSALRCNTTVSLLLTVHASETFSSTSCGCGWIFLVMGGVSSPKFLQLLFLVDLMHPGSTLPSREEFWGIETWVIRPHPSLRLRSTKRASCCDDATKYKFECRHTLKERLPKSNLSCRGVKQFNPITPSAGVGNLQTKNEWLKVTLPIWNQTCSSPTITRLSPVTPKCSNVVLSSGTSTTPGCKRLQLDPESTMRIRSASWILTATVGVPWSSVTGTVTKLLTALAGNLRWKLLPWLLSATRFPDDGCFDEQLQHKCCLTFAFPVVWFADPFPLFSGAGGGGIFRKAFFGKMSCFPTLKTKQFPFATCVCRAGVLLSPFPAYMRRVCANTSSLSILWSSKVLPGLTKVASNFSGGFRILKKSKFLFSCVSASNTVTAIWSAKSSTRAFEI